MRLHTLAAGLLFLAGSATFAGAQDVRVQFNLGTSERPLTGQRYQTMRALAHYLDERADYAADEAARRARDANPRERRSLWALQHFSGQARNFHQRMDNYVERPWNLPNEVRELNAEARRVNQRMRAAGVFRETWTSWSAVLDALGRMNRLLAGQRVSVPPAHRTEWGDYQRDYAPWSRGGYGDMSGDRLVGGRLQEFRQLADRLETETARARDDAEYVGRASARNAMVSREIGRLSQHASALQNRTQSSALDKSDVAPTVRTLLSDARRTDRSLRSSSAFNELRSTWTSVIRTLEQMDDMVST
jgi:hypothetical protein